jgi:hypothetical protein
MEYPTITFITTQSSGQELDATIIHKLGHNWFYGALASNERKHSWMDEGMNTFYHQLYEREKYKPENKKNKPGKLPADEEQLLLSTIIKLKKDQPIESPAASFSNINYGLIVYTKAAQFIQKLEQTLGKETFDRSMQNYYNEWKFKHPYPEDFKASVEKTAGRNLHDVFQLLNETGPISPTGSKTIKPTFLLNLKDTDKFNYVSIAPALGYNFYDKGMIGGMLHNYQLPIPNFQFIGGFLYGTGSKKMNGFGRVAYTSYQRRKHITTALSYMSYSIDKFKTDEKNTLFFGMRRITPSIQFTFFDKNPSSTRRFTAGFKTFFIREGNLDFNTIITPSPIPGDP